MTLPKIAGGFGALYRSAEKALIRERAFRRVRNCETDVRSGELDESAEFLDDNETNEESIPHDIRYDRVIRKIFALYYIYRLSNNTSDLI